MISFKTPNYCYPDIPPSRTLMLSTPSKKKFTTNPAAQSRRWAFEASVWHASPHQMAESSPPDRAGLLRDGII
ncbi:hypothetical protein GCM10009086_39930 [Pseudomonas rhodesiae]